MKSKIGRENNYVRNRQIMFQKEFPLDLVHYKVSVEYRYDALFNRTPTDQRYRKTRGLNYY